MGFSVSSCRGFIHKKVWVNYDYKWCLKSLWMFFYTMIIVVIWHDFYDTTMWYLSFIWLFILRFLPWFYGFILDISWWWFRSYKASMDGLMERMHVSLIDVMMCPHREWCRWHFNHEEFGHIRDVTVSSPGLPMPTPVVGLGI